MKYPHPRLLLHIAYRKPRSRSKLCCRSTKKNGKGIIMLDLLLWNKIRNIKIDIQWLII